jgi:hypothetical protein
MHTYSLSSLFLCTTLVLGCFGCEEEGVPPTSPQVLSASLVCSQQGTEYYLESFSMVVEDINGSETLLDPSVEVLSVAIPLNSTPLLSAKGKANQAAEETSMMDEVEEAAEAEETDETDETDETPMNMPEVEQDSCTFESCKMRYTWDIQDSSESGSILCGDDGLALVAQVRIMDESGRLQQEITVNSEPL